ncbi:cytochrome oxidase assembly protein ShyY1 [Bradyrhizobium japonicum]
MNESARKPRVAGFALFTLFLAAVLVALGVWQLQRRVAKHQLIAALTERLAAAPVALPPPSQWSTLTPERDEFRRVTFTATYESRLDAMVYSSGSAIRSDISGPGTWAFLPARLPGGDMVAVNAGFVPNTQQDRALQDRAVAGLITNKPAMLTGYVRFPETASVLMPDAERDKRLWFTRDHLAMSRALGWGTVRAVLHRPGAAGARERHSASRSARRASEGRSSAIRHHLVRARRRGADRIRRLGEGTAPGLKFP